MATVLSFNLLSQDIEALTQRAAFFFQNKNYSAALETFGKLEKLMPNDAGVLAKMGICYFETNRTKEAEIFLYRSFQANGEPPPFAYLYLGKLDHSRFDFEKAAQHYKNYLRKTPPSNPLHAFVKDEIRRCANGIRLRRKKGSAKVANMGSPVNSESDDFRPLPSPNYSGLLYFTSDRTSPTGQRGFYYDVYFTEKNEDTWSAPQPLSAAVNTFQNEAALGFDEAGGRLYFFRGNTFFYGQILVDTFQEDRSNANVQHRVFKSPMLTEEGDCDPCFFNDTTLFFSSRRPGGFGGFDIYKATFGYDGWSEPENLGPAINSGYDERAPFLTRDGLVLYFSTNDARRSIGGLDILKSNFLFGTKKWAVPENMGMPINSAADDAYFVLSDDGASGWFSSSRKTGFGKRDLYFVEFDLWKK